MSCSGSDGEGDDFDDRDDAGEAGGPLWLPPGADAAGEDATFSDQLEAHFWVPDRLADKSASVVEAVNDFHFAMINDVPRNLFYRTALENAVRKGHTVLEIGTGSGLLAMLAARAGPEHVYAVEANRNMADLAQQLIASNGLAEKVTVINALSTEVRVGKGAQDLPCKADVLVSEILGTLLLGESALAFVSDCRKRLLAPDATIIPATGVQFVSLIECADIKSITSASNWGGINLEGFDALQDTCNVVFTKQYGFRLSSVPYKTIASRIPVAEVDFYTDDPQSLPETRRMTVRAEKAGTVHACMLYWEVYSDRERTDVMSTDPEVTRDNFPRDMQWGQGLQLVEDTSRVGPCPVPLAVEAGEELELLIRFSRDRAVMQFQILRAGAAAAGGAAAAAAAADDDVE